ncbi:MAG: polysaccharide deacetylase family protein [Planctomycetota bacterium]
MFKYLKALKSLPKFCHQDTLETIPVFYSHEISIEAFESLCKFLVANNYQTLSADEYYHEIQNYEIRDLKSEIRKVVLTFDDGRRGNWAIVYPLLKKYQLKAVFFIIPTWISDAGFLLLPCARGRSASGGKETDAKLPNLNDYWQGKITLDKIYQSLREEPYFRWSEVKEMSQSGVVDIQSHSLYHHLCFIDKQLIDFQHPKPWGTPAYSDLWTAYGKNHPEEMWGAPVYPTAWSETVNQKYIPDFNLVKLCCDYVAQNGGVKFYQLSDWKKRLAQVVKDYQRQHQFNDNIISNQPSNAETIKKSLETARLIIEDKCQKPIKHLALPYHKGNPLIYQAAKDAGYLTIFDDFSNTGSGFVFTEDIFHISRFRMRWAMMLPGKGRLTITKKIINTILGRRLSIEE